MNKKEVMDVVMSLETKKNKKIVNRLLRKLDLIPEEEILQIFNGKSKNWIEAYFNKIISVHSNKYSKDYTEYKKLNNSLFSYSTDKECIILHMVYDLHEVIQLSSEMYNKAKLRKILNYQLLDAINKIVKLWRQGDNELKDKKYLYMISPLLYGNTELIFLQRLGFLTKSFKKGDTKNVGISQWTDERLNVGMAIIPIDEIESPEFKEVKHEMIEELRKLNISKEDIMKFIEQTIAIDHRKYLHETLEELILY